MYEDFNYITDQNFLANYWRHETVTCRKCQGNGSLKVGEDQTLMTCTKCHGKGKIQRHQQQEIPVA